MDRPSQPHVVRTRALDRIRPNAPAQPGRPKPSSRKPSGARRKP